MQTASTLEQSIREFILEEFLPGEDPAQLRSDTPLVTAGVLDSIATLKLVQFLEGEFSITIEAHETDAENLDTLDRIVQLVLSKRG